MMRLVTPDKVADLCLVFLALASEEEMMARKQERRAESEEGKPVAIYHVVYEKEDFEDAAQKLFGLVTRAQEVNPGASRLLFLDIEGHQNTKGGFDHDMYELQTGFILGFLMQFLTEAHLPLGGTVRRQEGSSQSDDLPDTLNINPAPG